MQFTSGGSFREGGLYSSFVLRKESDWSLELGSSHYSNYLEFRMNLAVGRYFMDGSLQTSAGGPGDGSGGADGFIQLAARAVPSGSTFALSIVAVGAGLRRGRRR